MPRSLYVLLIVKNINYIAYNVLYTRNFVFYCYYCCFFNKQLLRQLLTCRVVKILMFEKYAHILSACNSECISIYVVCRRQNVLVGL